MPAPRKLRISAKHYPILQRVYMWFYEQKIYLALKPQLARAIASYFVELEPSDNGDIEHRIGRRLRRKGFRRIVDTIWHELIAQGLLAEFYLDTRPYKLDQCSWGHHAKHVEGPVKLLGFPFMKDVTDTVVEGEKRLILLHRELETAETFLAGLRGHAAEPFPWEEDYVPSSQGMRGSIVHLHDPVFHAQFCELRERDQVVRCFENEYGFPIHSVVVEIPFEHFARELVAWVRFLPDGCDLPQFDEEGRRVMLGHLTRAAYLIEAYQLELAQTMHPNGAVPLLCAHCHKTFSVLLHYIDYRKSTAACPYCEQQFIPDAYPFTLDFDRDGKNLVLCAANEKAIREGKTDKSYFWDRFDPEALLSGEHLARAMKHAQELVASRPRSIATPLSEAREDVEDVLSTVNSELGRS